MPSNLVLGSISSANRETRIMRLRQYLQAHDKDGAGFMRLSVIEALHASQITSFQTLFSYLQEIEKLDLADKELENCQILLREAELLSKNQRSKKKY